ncbi:MAG TPA: response regulator [Opitutaceae bacterium]|jgi:DNA-binding response OmpR family regulator|nr:response regulator [Opitutaceae bacterium]
MPIWPFSITQDLRDFPKPILVVDDDSPVREQLVRVLVDAGFTAVPAADGEEALEIARQVRPRLVLLDLGLPGQSGWATLVSLTRLIPTASVIIITAEPNQADAARAAGAGAFFEKPLEFPALLHAVRTLLFPAPQTT